jgi:hypothetical protein
MAGRILQDEETPGTPPELSGDFADLAAIAAAADARIDGSAATLVPGAAPEPEPDRGAEFGAMLQLLVNMGAPALPFLPQCYTPETCQQIGTAFAAVAEKHGWQLDAMNSPELALAIVAIPPSAAAYMLGREHFAARRAALAGPSSSPAPHPAAPAPSYSPERIGA